MRPLALTIVSGMFLLISATVILSLFSCKHSSHLPKPPADAETIRRKQELSRFLSKFRILPNRLLELNFINIDNSLTKINEPTDLDFIGYGAAYGMLPDTSRFYALLWYSADADQAGLKLTTLNKTGKKLDEQWLTATFPSDDCGYEWHGKAYIEKNMAILIRDSIVTYDCDNGIPPESTWEHEVDSMNVKISSTGKIEFSKIRQSKPR